MTRVLFLSYRLACCFARFRCQLRSMSDAVGTESAGSTAREIGVHVPQSSSELNPVSVLRIVTS